MERCWERHGSLHLVKTPEQHHKEEEGDGVGGHADCRAMRAPTRWIHVKDAVKTEAEDRDRRKGTGGAQYFLNSASSGGLTSTFLLATSFQLVLRTVPPDSICTGRRDTGKIRALEGFVVLLAVMQHLLSAQRLLRLR